MTRSVHHTKGHSMELRFTVWQFVRLMVYTEAHPNACFDDWQDVWAAIDQELTVLAQSNSDAYGEMMMNQEVVIDNATPIQINTTYAVLKDVMSELDAMIITPKIRENTDEQGQNEHLQSLKFERRGLRQFTRKLVKMNAFKV